jgi:hypothetical protein
MSVSVLTRGYSNARDGPHGVDAANSFIRSTAGTREETDPRHCEDTRTTALWAFRGDEAISSGRALSRPRLLRCARNDGSPTFSSRVGGPKTGGELTSPDTVIER